MSALRKLVQDVAVGAVRDEFFRRWREGESMVTDYRQIYRDTISAEVERLQRGDYAVGREGCEASHAEGQHASEEGTVVENGQRRAEEVGRRGKGDPDR
jgi:hypothetical protein